MHKLRTRKILSLVLSLVLCFGLFSSVFAEGAPELTQKILDNVYEPNFSIELLEDGIKKVLDGDGRELYLVPREMETPAELEDKIVIPCPVENAVFLSSTQTSVFQAVNDEETIARVGGLNMDKDFWTFIPEFPKAMEEDKIKFIGAADGMGEPDYEAIQNLNPDVVFVYSGDYGQVNEIAKFEELGINYAVDNDYLEKDYMARMEWIRFVLTFFDRDIEGKDIMLSAKTSMDRIFREIEAKEEPKVAYFNVWEGTYYPTAGDSWISNLIKDMGAVNVFDEADVNNLTEEVAFELIQDADIIIYSSNMMYFDGLNGLKDAFPLLEECKAYQNNKVFALGDDFWNGLVETDRLAKELAAVFHPELNEKFYVHIDTKVVEVAEEVVEEVAEEVEEVAEEVEETEAEESKAA